MTWALAAAALAAAGPVPAGPAPGEAARLPVPVIRQAPERCGPAALAMVLRYYGAGPAAVAEAGRAYDRALRGALITDLAAAARRAGFRAEVAASAPDSLRALLASGVPPIILFQAGPAPITRAHYAVIVGWDPGRARWWLNDGGASSRAVPAAELERRWRAAGAQALIVRRPAP